MVWYLICVIHADFTCDLSAVFIRLDVHVGLDDTSLHHRRPICNGCAAILDTSTIQYASSSFTEVNQVG